ncbi:probable G-protein coupled receptor 139 [Electrophorus electricus]|uniref:probable G-protein coupled receptor 139 n=1 Tax=Electrophorus electricus TaxID=8005 RepID=UPI0015D0ABD5|nr:probable G-protein coupled receptor 139 [Electrophorus electricus]
MDGSVIFVDVQKVYYPLLCIVGIPANLFTFYMICFRACGMSPSARVYLSFLALMDTWYLVWVVLLELSLTFLQVEHFWNVQPWCGLSSTLQYASFYGSAWLVAAFTVERYHVLRATAGRERPQQARHALFTCTAIVLLSHLASVPVSWINEVVQVNVTQAGQVETVSRCLYREALYSTVVVWVTSFISSGVPILLVLLFNALIAHHLLWTSRLFTREERQTLQAHVGTRGSVPRTLLLLATVSATFVVLTLPRYITYCILRTTYNQGDFNRDNYAIPINVVSDVANMLHNLNSATNFLLYCVVSQRFRQELLNTVRCRSRARELGSLLTHTTMRVFSVSAYKDAARRDPVTVVLTKLRRLNSLACVPPLVSPSNS